MGTTLKLSRRIQRGTFPESQRWAFERLFDASEVGVLYDPSDLSTLFQDSAGTTPVTAPGQPVGLVLDKSGNGNHASQTTAASRPIYGVVPKGGRRNLLLSSDTLATQTRTVTAVAHTLSFQGTGTVTLSGVSTAGPLVGTGASNTVSLTFTPTDGGLTLTVSGSVSLAQLEIGSSRTNYQRVGATAFDITEQGVPTCHYLQFDGIDDGLSTAAIDFTGTDKMSVFAGVRKLSDAAQGTLVELTNNSTNAGAFSLLVGNNTATRRVAWSIASPQDLIGTADQAGVVSFVTDAVLDRSGANAAGSIFPAINGFVPTSSEVIDGNATGNFANSQLFIGRRAGTSNPFNGQLFGLIARGVLSSTAEIRQAEKLLAKKTSQVALSVTANLALIVTQPQSQTINSGSAVTLSVFAVGAASYQWQVNDGAGWANISGAASSSYTSGLLTYDDHDGMQYRVVCTSPSGSVTSNVATITVQLVGDRYISTAGSDSADGLTRGTAWATVARLNTWIGSLSAGTHKAVVVAGTYTNSNGFFSNNNNAINLTVDFESGVTIDTSAAVTKQDGISIGDNATSAFVFNLRGASFIGNAVSSANGIGTANVVNLVVNGGGAEFSGYDDGASFHFTSGTADQIQINDCRFFQCSKSAFYHIGASRGTHNRCIFEGHTGARIGRCDAPGSNFYDCVFLNRGSSGLGFFDSIVGRCQLGEVGSSAVAVTLDGRITVGMQGISTFTDCYVNAFGDTRIWYEGGGMTRCYGTFSWRERVGSGTMVGGEIRDCVFSGSALTQNSELGHTKLNFIDTIFIGGTFGAAFSVTQQTAWNADSGWSYCCLFGSTVGAGIAGSVTNSITTDPLIGAANTVNQADWAVASNSPCVGAGTGGGNIGFTLADIS